MKAGIVVAFLAILIVGIAHPAVTATPDVCSREEGRFIPDCPTTCKGACEDPGFNRSAPVARLCDKLFAAVARGTRDGAVCAEGTAAATGRETARKTAEECQRKFPGDDGSGPGGIEPLLPPLPACLGTINRMTCRLTALAERAREVIGKVDQIRQRNYGTVIGLDMCKIQQRDVEMDYRNAESVAQPLEILSADYKLEFDCLETVKNALAKRDCTKGDGVCDRRNEAMRSVLDTRMKPNFDLAGDVSTSLTTAKQAVTDIRRFWSDYVPLCR